MTPKRTWNWPRVAAWLAVTRPRPSRTPPQSTTARVPNRSDSAPQANDPTPMLRKLRSAAIEMPARDQPIAADMRASQTLSERIAPSPPQVTTIPTPTMVHPQQSLKFPSAAHRGLHQADKPHWPHRRPHGLTPGHRAAGSGPTAWDHRALHRGARGELHLLDDRRLSRRGVGRSSRDHRGQPSRRGPRQSSGDAATVRPRGPRHPDGLGRPGRVSESGECPPLRRPTLGDQDRPDDGLLRGLHHTLHAVPGGPRRSAGLRRAAIHGRARRRRRRPHRRALPGARGGDAAPPRRCRADGGAVHGRGNPPDPDPERHSSPWGAFPARRAQGDDRRPARRPRRRSSGVSRLNTAVHTSEVETMSVKGSVIAQFEQVAREQKKTLVPLSDDLVLLDSGLDSLCLAIIVARLEDALGVDPFDADADAAFPVTVGDFIRLYEDAAH